MNYLYRWITKRKFQIIFDYSKNNRNLNKFDGKIYIHNHTNISSEHSIDDLDQFGLDNVEFGKVLILQPIPHFIHIREIARRDVVLSLKTIYNCRNKGKDKIEGLSMTFCICHQGCARLQLRI